MEPEPRIVGHGLTAIVTTVDDKTVLKGYEVWSKGKLRAKCGEPSEDRLVREDIVYQHLGHHPFILQSFGLKEVRPGVHSLCLEMAPLGCIRLHTQSTLSPVNLLLPKLPDPPLNARLQMALDAARALSYVHSRGVLTCDFSYRKIFLFPDFRIKLGDFGGALLQGHSFKNDQNYEGRYQLPLRGRDFDDLDMVKQELFALGVVIYEITMWRRPFDDLSEDSCGVDVRYAREEFPLLEPDNPVRDVIKGCWMDRFDRAGQVVDGLERCLRISENN
ncbi:kinase-like protein [Dichotomopilus funicola]|uniref:Kinase-like protein n=1 Tax=Dichotomopilus funicola TaxID=1934379 RepID=A0AAN6ZJX1_9PEZI|nr:kinase-like protein [Dichotomopilus funicola]